MLLLHTSSNEFLSSALLTGAQSAKEGAKFESGPSCRKEEEKRWPFEVESVLMWIFWMYLVLLPSANPVGTLFC